MAHQLIHDPLPGVEARPYGGHYTILDHGAHVLAWQPPGERPVLWTSRKSQFEPGVAIRGGVPVIFPWFGSGRTGSLKPAHGFARTVPWRRVLVDDGLDSGGPFTVEYVLDDSATGHPDAFPHQYQAALVARFGSDELEVALTVTNTCDEEFSFEAALHTYLAVGDIRHVHLAGLDGLTYLDTVPGAPSGPQIQQGLVRFSAETDRLYDHTGEVLVVDEDWGRTLRVTKDGSATTVVWNPWVAKAAAMGDFGDDEWPEMLCIEAANVRHHAVTLAPGDSHRMAQRILVA